MCINKISQLSGRDSKGKIKVEKEKKRERKEKKRNKGIKRIKAEEGKINRS
jgi:hypothetical protein